MGYYHCDTCGGYFDDHHQRVKIPSNLIFGVYAMLYTCKGCEEKRKYKNWGRDTLQ